MYQLPIIATIAEDRVRELHQIAEANRDARLARQHSARLRERGQARTPAALRLLPARIRPRAV
jgi:hypothetical protein